MDKGQGIWDKGQVVLSIIFLTAGVAYQQVRFEFVEEADTYFVMNLGRYVLEHGVPHVDPFTVNENLQLVAQQWLSGVFFWQAFDNFGLSGLLMLDWICGALSIVIYWKLCELVGGNKSVALTMAFVIGLFVAPMFVPRPQIFSTPLFVTEIFLLEKFTRSGDTKFLLPLLPLSTLLINLHAAVWFMSIVLCLPFLFVKNMRHIKFLLAAMAGVTLCGLINPYGVEAMTYVLRSYGIDLINSLVPEMFTPTAHNLRGKLFYLTEAALIFSLAKFKIPWRFVLLSGGLTFLAIMHARNLQLFYLAATLPIIFALKNFAAGKFFADGRGVLTLGFFAVLFVNTALVVTILNDELGKLSMPLEILFGAATFFMLYILLIVKVDGRILHPNILPRKILSLTVTALIIGGIFGATFKPKQPPQTFTHAIEFLLKTERPEDISLYVPQGIGGLAGSYGIRYYIDSRSEVFLAVNNGRKDIFVEYMDFIGGKIFYKDFFARYNFTHIILTNNTPFLFDELSNDKNFRVIYESERVDGQNVVRCKIFVPKEFH